MLKKTYTLICNFTDNEKYLLQTKFVNLYYNKENMELSSEEKQAAIQLFRWVSPNIDYVKKRWYKGDSIELNKIYEYRDGFGRPIAIWTEFESLSDVRIARILKKINAVPHVFFLEYYNNRVRIGFKVKKELRLDDTKNRITPDEK